MIPFSRRLPSDYTPNRIALRLEERRRSGARILDLTRSNPTRVGLPAPSISDWSALLEGAAAPYEPQPLGGLATREAISAYYDDRGIRVSPDRIVLTASTSEAYAHLFRVLCDPGDGVLIPEPSYPLFEPLALLEGVRAIPYRLRLEPDGWRADLESVRAALDPSTRALLLVHPNNPTGSLASLTEAAFLDALCSEHGLALVADEVFGDFVVPPPIGRAERHGSFASGRAALTFVLSGLSKVCGLPQAKLAWIVLAGPEREANAARDRLEWVADAFLSVSPAVQSVAPRLLAARHAFQSAMRQRLARNLEVLDVRLRASARATRLPLDGGWSAVVRLPATLAEEEWVERLLERDVLVHPGHFFDFSEGAHVVLSLIPEPEEFDLATRRLLDALAEEGG